MSNLLLILLCSILPVLLTAEMVIPINVIGNLAVIATPESHIGNPNKTLYADIPNLWCGAQKLGEHLDVEYGEFTRLSDGKVFPGTLNQGKVYLEIGKANVRVTGRYRCEVRTLDKQIHSGNLIIYCNSENIEYDGNNLILKELAEEHAGKYRCTGDNSFPLFVDGPSIPHQLYFDQDIKVV
ncbi:Protein CBR-ZIG-7 [Caenorhabditis briggsae]|uniref:Protein CBR-ZIG-7 n=1 Tax=Caenorhabditis briggsae TaxID=6238 RepID=A8WVU3_CAEBR|nr:Protein CBR-ZIG-7 [Caenorhabditis briggsae]CAP24756.2 Protein CBR-ZIG-7 [Caenorhabditis briggsae]